MKRPSVSISDIFSNGRGNVATVVGYENSNKVSVIFAPDLHIHDFTAQNLRDGKFFDRYEPSVMGVGFVGIGSYTMKTHPIVDSAWRAMLKRCYSDEVQKVSKSYRGCSVHPDWHNFQVFAEWYTKQEGYGLGFDLDKDLIVKGNKVYSEWTCCLLPREINSLLQLKESDRQLPYGISVKRGKYEVRAKLGGKTVWLGSFSYIGDAEDRYIQSKREYCKKLIEKWQGNLGVEVIDKLEGWDFRGENHE